MERGEARVLKHVCHLTRITALRERQGRREAPMGDYFPDRPPNKTFDSDHYGQDEQSRKHQPFRWANILM